MAIFFIDLVKGKAFVRFYIRLVIPSLDTGQSHAHEFENEILSRYLPAVFGVQLLRMKSYRSGDGHHRCSCV